MPLGGAPKWNHAGIWVFSCFERRRGAKVSLAALAVFITDKTQKGREEARGPLDGGDQDVRGKAGGFGGMPRWRVFIIASVKCAHLGLDWERSRYVLSRTISMALFLARMSSRPKPPSLIGEHSLAIPIVGTAEESQTNSLEILTSASSICFGIP